jgi:hypothetical protein
MFASFSGGRLGHAARKRAAFGFQLLGECATICVHAEHWPSGHQEGVATQLSPSSAPGKAMAHPTPSGGSSGRESRACRAMRWTVGSVTLFWQKPSGKEVPRTAPKWRCLGRGRAARHRRTSRNPGAVGSSCCLAAHAGMRPPAGFLKAVSGPPLLQWKLSRGRPRCGAELGFGWILSASVEAPKGLQLQELCALRMHGARIRAEQRNETPKGASQIEACHPDPDAP